jgi:hypothetical protein
LECTRTPFTWTSNLLVGICVMVWL